MTTRIFQAVPLAIHTSIQLTEAASHHLARVLRAQINDPVIIFNGQGGEYEGVIQRIDKKSVTVQLETFNPREAESPLEIYLAQGISRGEKMDYTLQKAVELGVKGIIPLFTERCNVKLDVERGEKKQQHWQSVVVSACEQSGRNRVPMVAVPQSFAQWVGQAAADFCFVLAPGVDGKLKQLAVPSHARIILLIGPEGGLSEQEIAQALQRGFKSLNLGPRVLRTETAALAAIAALQGLFGDM